MSELIELLSGIDPEMEVVGRGYESGFDEVVIPQVVTVMPTNNPSYEGYYQEPEEWNESDRIGPNRDVFYIG